MNSNNRIIGITGGIGSGKSVVTDELINRGYTVLDADLLSREAVASGSAALIEIVSKFGDEVIDTAGGLNRKAISDIIFTSPEKMNMFNNIMRTAIGAMVDEHAESYATANNISPLFFSAALMYEAGWDKKCDEVWLVTAADGIRARRAAVRDGVTEKSIQERMAFQMPEAEKRKRATVVIENSGSLDELIAQVNLLLRSLQV